MRAHNTCKIGNQGGWHTLGELRCPLAIFAAQCALALDLVEAEEPTTRRDDGPVREGGALLHGHKNG